MTQINGSDNPIAHLNALKLKLVNDDDFTAIKDYFFDHLGENRAFLQMGKPKRDKRLEKILSLAVQSTFKTEQVVMQDMFYPANRLLRSLSMNPV